MIKGIEGLSTTEINDELTRGAKFVVYQYCISCLIMTFKRNSKIYFVRAGENSQKHSIPYLILSLTLGWWGIPWGPIYTVSSVIKNLCGGVDVTEELLEKMNEANTSEDDDNQENII